MGAEYFDHFVNGIEDLDKAYHTAVEEAEYDYGHSGYTGTIAETGGAKNLGDTPQSVKTLTEARTRADELIDDERIEDKWGPCGALRVKDEAYDGWLFFGWASS